MRKLKNPVERLLAVVFCLILTMLLAIGTSAWIGARLRCALRTRE